MVDSDIDFLGFLQINALFRKQPLDAHVDASSSVMNAQTGFEDETCGN